MLSDLFQRTRLIFPDPEAQPDDGLLSGGQGAENPIHFTGEFRTVHMRVRRDRLLVREQLAELRAAITDPMLQRHRFLEGLNGLMQPIRSHPHGGGHFFQARLASQLLHETARGPENAVRSFRLVHGNSDGA